MSTSTPFSFPTIFTGDEGRGKYTMRVKHMSKYRPRLLKFLKAKALDPDCDVQIGSWLFNLFFQDLGFESDDMLSFPNEKFILLPTSAEGENRAIFVGKVHLCERVEDEDDHPESLGAGDIRPVQELIDVSAGDVVQKVAAIPKDVMMMSAIRPVEDTKPRLRRVHNERMAAKKSKLWLELKTTVEVAATKEVPAHVSTTQWHFWNAVFLDVLPSLSAPERAARLLVLESRDITEDNPRPWSEIWQTYQYVRYIDEIKTTGWDKTLYELSEGYEKFLDKLSGLDLATRMALGLAVALPPVRTEGASVFAESTLTKSSTPDTPVVDTSTRRTKVLRKSQATRKNLGLARLAEKVIPASDVAAPPAPVPVPMSTNIFGLPLAVSQKPHPQFGGFTFNIPASKTATAHPKSMLLRPGPVAQSSEAAIFDFGFAKSTFGKLDSTCAPNSDGSTVFGRTITPHARESSLPEQMSGFVAPTCENTKSLSAIFGASPFAVDAITTAPDALTMVVVAERQIMYEDDECSGYVNGYECLAQFDCDDHDSLCLDDTMDGADSVDRVALPEVMTKSTEFKSACSEDVHTLSSISASRVTPSLTHSLISEGEFAIDSEMAEDYMIDGYCRPLELTGDFQQDKKFFDAVSTKIVAEADQHEFEWADSDYLVGPPDEDDEEDYAVLTVDEFGKPIKLALDMEPLEGNWARDVLLQAFPGFEEAEAELPDVAPQLVVEVDQTLFSDMFDSAYVSESFNIPEDTSMKAAKLPDMQLVDALMSSLGSVFADCNRLLDGIYPQAAAVDARAKVKKADHCPDSHVARKFAFKPMPAQDIGPQDGIQTRNSPHRNSAMAPPWLRYRCSNSFAKFANYCTPAHLYIAGLELT
jgi:hypothetical protein